MSEAKKPLCGFLNILKPPGMTSSQVVGYVRWLLNGAKVGHGGTLDPEASGVLPLMVGKAARLFDYMQEKEKVYVTEVAFGAATDTQDAQGQVIASGENYPDEAALRAALPAFTGRLWQRPPMYSALKQDGQRLYELARKGRTAEIPKREVTVHSLELRGHDGEPRRAAEGALLQGLLRPHPLQRSGRGAGLPRPYALSAPGGKRRPLRCRRRSRWNGSVRPKKDDRTSKRCCCRRRRCCGICRGWKRPPGWKSLCATAACCRYSAFEGGEKVPEGGDACLWLSGELMARSPSAEP